jgi:hypothetical protein
MIVLFKLNNKNCTTTNRVPYGGGNILPGPLARGQAGIMLIKLNKMSNFVNYIKRYAGSYTYITEGTKDIGTVRGEYQTGPASSKY